ncbi:uroporphyrinogen-III C-methyltransferase [Lacticaseibacillus sp. GG6-2]
MSGFVSLVGAGPGDPELITVLGQRRLNEADVVVYDRLVDPRLWTGLQAELIDVGKRPGHQPYSQTQINALLGQQATAGRRVVRLKAGDPYVFGRGGEEALYLQAQHIDFEVVPGVTSAIAGLAADGIPITHRGLATSFHVFTGHTRDGKPLDWPVIAQLDGTLVFLMGMAALPEIQAQLLANGKASTTPAAVIQSATHWQQRSVTADLAHIAATAATAELKAPALIVIGPVVQLAERLRVHLPLSGGAVLVPEAQTALQQRLHDAGAAVATYRLGRVPEVVAHAVIVASASDVQAIGRNFSQVPMLALDQASVVAAERSHRVKQVMPATLIREVSTCIPST